MTTAAGESMDPQAHDCSVCNEPFTDPKLLPCGHLLCRCCLLAWMQTQDDARCPLCRDLIVGPKDRQSQSLEDLVGGFPTDLSMELILEADQILSQQHNCCVCEDVAATAMCFNCREMLCQACKKAHGKMLVSKHHIVEDLAALTAEKVAANHSAPCSAHPGEMPKLFCPTHGASICLLCAASKHRSCPEVKELEENVEESQALLKQLTATLTEGEAHFDKTINELDQHLLDIQKSAEAAIAEIESMCNELDALVKKHRQRLKERVVTARSAVEEAVKEGSALLLQRRTKLSTHGRTVHRVREAKNRKVVATMALKMKQRVNDLNYDITLPEDAKIIPTFAFIKSSAALSQVKQGLENLAEVPMQPANVAANRQRFVFHNNHGTSVTLSNDNHTVTKSQDGVNGIVLSRDPLHVNMLYEVLIDKWVSERAVYVGHHSLLVGVAAVSPANMTLPQWSGHRQWPAWISPSRTDCAGVWDGKNKVGAALRSLGESHRVGLALDSARRLHLYVDGRDQGVAAHDMPDPCYAMFDVIDRYEQITALPVTALPQ